MQAKSILHFLNDEIVENANQLGVSLGSNDTEISNSVNDLLDLEAERALEMIRNIATVKPMRILRLMRARQFLCGSNATYY